MPVVVVESPAKAKTINKYLGDNFTVLASYGHVRDLPPKNGSVDTDNEFEMLWEIDSGSKKHVKAIADALKNDNELILATFEFFKINTCLADVNQDGSLNGLDIFGLKESAWEGASQCWPLRAKTVCHITMW